MGVRSFAAQRAPPDGGGVVEGPTPVARPTLTPHRCEPGGVPTRNARRCDDPLRLRVAFDSRAAKETYGIGRYARCLLQALRESGRGEIVETNDPRRGDVYHAPWIDGAILRCPVPMVVTLHDLIPLKRRGEYLRTGLRFKLRYLAVQRAVRVIVPSNVVADDAINELGIPPGRIAVIGEAAAPALGRRPDAEVQEVRERYGLPERYLLWVGGLRTPD